MLLPKYQLTNLRVIFKILSAGDVVFAPQGIVFFAEQTWFNRNVVCKACFFCKVFRFGEDELWGYLWVSCDVEGLEWYMSSEICILLMYEYCVHEATIWNVFKQNISF